MFRLATVAPGYEYYIDIICLSIYFFLSVSRSHPAVALSLVHYLYEMIMVQKGF